jgi:cytochrome c biogenesis protein CcmG/thiol:disulfide interchange protein DsbE
MKLKGAIHIILWPLLLLLVPCCTGDKAVGRVAIGERIPDFRYEDITGIRGSLGELKGRVVLLRFWADWCPYCKFEMPRINVFYQRLRDKGFDVVAVNVGQTRDVVEAFTAQLNLSYQMVMDPDGKVARAYGVKGIPTNFLIDRAGIVREILIGEIFIEDRVLEDLLRPYFPDANL